MSDDRDTSSSSDSDCDECNFKISVIPTECNFTKKEKKEYYDELRKLNLAKMRAKRSQLELVSLKTFQSDVM